VLLALLSAGLGCVTCDVRTRPGSGTLQDAIDRADNGDTLKICAGTHSGVFAIDRDLTLQAFSNDDEVWLDGEGQGPVLTVTDAVVVLIGIGIENSGTNAEGVGGGLWIERQNTLSPPYVSLSRVTIRDGQDSGIVLTGGILVAEELTLQNNQAAVGGGLRVLSGSASLVLSSILENDADLGGGIYVDDGSEVALTNSQVCGNSATNGGGAWLVAGNDEEAPGQLTSLSTDWCAAPENNTPDDVATVSNSYSYGDVVDFSLAGPED
jgi:hypothetical protein